MSNPLDRLKAGAAITPAITTTAAATVAGKSVGFVLSMDDFKPMKPDKSGGDTFTGLDLNFNPNDLPKFAPINQRGGLTPKVIAQQKPQRGPKSYNSGMEPKVAYETDTMRTFERMLQSTSMDQDFVFHVQLYYGDRYVAAIRTLVSRVRAKLRHQRKPFKEFKLITRDVKHDMVNGCDTVTLMRVRPDSDEHKESRYAALTALMEGE